MRTVTSLYTQPIAAKALAIAAKSVTALMFINPPAANCTAQVVNSIPFSDTMQQASKVEVVDVGPREHERSAEDHIAATYLDLAEPPGVERNTAALQRSLHQRIAGVHRQVSEVVRVPQNHCLDHAFVNIRLAQIDRKSVV